MAEVLRDMLTRVMDFTQQIDLNSITYFTVQLIIAFGAFGFFVFSLFVSRQVQLMNRVLTTRLAGVFQFISLAFIISSGFIFALTVLALLT